MTVNESHPIRATINIKWKKGSERLKIDFENELRKNCDQFADTKQKKAIFKLLGVSTEFQDKYDIIGKIGNTCQFSYILKDTLGGKLKNSFDLFNNKDHITEHVKYIQSLLTDVINNSKIKKRKFLRPYVWKAYFSVSNINFKKKKFIEVMKEETSILLGWFIAPITKLFSVYFNKLGHAYNEKTRIPIGIQNLINQTTFAEILISSTIIILIYLTVVIVKWRQEKNVIRL